MNFLAAMMAADAFGLHTPMSRHYTTNYRPLFDPDPEQRKRCDLERLEAARLRRERRAAKKDRNSKQ